LERRVTGAALRKEGGVTTKRKTAFDDTSEVPPDEGKDSTAEREAWVALADVKPETVAWLWNGRLPLGKVSLLEGDPDVGKTTIALDIAARASRGAAMPNATEPVMGPCGVVILSAEDGLADTIRPRLEAAGANLEHIVAFRLESLPDLDPEGLAAIRAAVTAVDAKLVIVDPLMAFVPDKTDSHRDHHMRRLLTPLAALAHETGAAFLAVRHLNKSGGANAKLRGGGSIGITGAARSVMLAARDPDDETRCLLARVKGNLAPPWPTITYSLGIESDMVRVHWGGTIEQTADEILAAGSAASDDRETDDAKDNREDARSAIAGACDWLHLLLTPGWRATSAIREEATAAGMTWRTVERAKVRLRVLARKSGLAGPWGWELPQDNKPDDNPDDKQDPERGPHTANGAQNPEDRQGAHSPSTLGGVGGLRENPSSLRRPPTPTTPPSVSGGGAVPTVPPGTPPAAAIPSLTSGWALERRLAYSTRAAALEQRFGMLADDATRLAYAQLEGELRP